MINKVYFIPVSLYMALYNELNGNFLCRIIIEKYVFYSVKRPYGQYRGGALVDKMRFSINTSLVLTSGIIIFRILQEKKIVNIKIAREEKAFSHWQKGQLFSFINPSCL